jgi:hypothetical protein
LLVRSPVIGSSRLLLGRVSGRIFNRIARL